MTLSSPRYASHVAAVPGRTPVQLLAIPAGIAILAIAVIPAVFTAPLSMLLGYPLDGPVVNPASMIGMILTVIVAVLLMVKVSRLTPASLGLAPRRAGAEITRGALYGIAALLLVALVLNIVGAMRTGSSPHVSILAILVGFVFFAFQGTWEELVYRAYLMPHVEKMWGAWPAILGTSALFTLGHALNPGMTAMAVLNLFVASVVFSLLYRHTGSLLLTGLAHGMWNFTQGFLLGSPVSGNHVDGSLLQSSAPEGASALLSGGAFGFEGSLATTLLGCAIIAFFLLKGRQAAPATEGRNLQ